MFNVRKTLFGCLLAIGLNGWFAMTAMAVSDAGVGVPAAKRHALVVGAWKYPGLGERFQLRGPKNDAALVRRMLLDNGFPEQNIHVLSDEVDGAEGSPTRGAIMDVLKDFASKAKQDKGDFFYLHFAGHGSQQPAIGVGDDSLREADGLDEIFLPVDVGAWSDGIGAVENAITDNDISAAIDAMREAGGFVWAVFDSCHSGTMTRGVPLDGVRMRKVTPEVLGIPDAALARAAASAFRTRGAGGGEDAMLDVGDDGQQGKAGFVAFYAAQTTEQTPEMRLPAGDPDRKSMGLFSFTLMSVLAEHPGITYRQAMEQVLQRYAAKRVRRPTPMAEGVSLDAPVFGIRERGRVLQWTVRGGKEGWTVGGGSLHGLAEGALLAVVPAPASADDAVIGYLRVKEAKLLESRAVPEAFRGKPALDPKKLPKGARARLEEASLSLTLSVALPPAGEGNARQVARVRSVLETIRAREREQPAGLLLRWVEPGASADLHLAVQPLDPDADTQDMHLWLLPPTGVLQRGGAGKTPSIALEDKSDAQLEAALAGSLASVAKVTNLLRMAGYVGPDTGGGAGVEVSLSVTRAGKGGKNGCALAAAGATAEPIEPAVRSRLYANDGLAVRIENAGTRAADVTLLFVDSYFGVQVLYPVFKGHTTRLEAGASQSYCIPVTVDTVGIEHVLSIVVPAMPQTPEADFSFLAQASLPRTRGAGMRGGIGALFRQAGFGPVGTRGLGIVPSAEVEDVSMRLFSWETVPR